VTSFDPVRDGKPVESETAAVTWGEPGDNAQNVPPERLEPLISPKVHQGKPAERHCAD
jgi:hypothetical protein